MPLSEGQPESAKWVFASAPKTSELSHRCLPVADTLARLRECARRVPISRVSDLTPLDRLRLPVFSATTPLARDLTTHVGKGLDPPGAQVSAMMEAIERVSAEQVNRTVTRGSYRSLSSTLENIVDPRLFDLPHDSSYGEDVPISWVEGWDLVHHRPAWLPLDCAISPPQEGVLRDVDTNGLAAGNTLLEAIVHALCEVIERDAFSLQLFRSMFADAGDSMCQARRIAPDSLPLEGQQWAARISSAGLTLETEVLDSDIGVAVCRSIIIDHDFPASDGEYTRKFVGLGASPNAQVAAVRSITEAVQSRIAIVQGARDSYNTLSPAWRRSAAALHQRDLEFRERVPLQSAPTFASGNLIDDFRYLIARLVDAGFDRIVAVDLSQPDFGFPVVRIRVPGLSAFAVNRTRAGWRCLRYLL
jgi:ribosomal protein S12 methylthiotransferase accessory factor